MPNVKLMRLYLKAAWFACAAGYNLSWLVIETLRFLGNRLDSLPMLSIALWLAKKTRIFIAGMMRVNALYGELLSAMEARLEELKRGG